MEDEHDIADFLRAYFRATGYDLVHLDPDDEDQVLAGVRDHEPDCVLLDVRLRGFSGLDAYRRLRADPRFALVPVILVTADATAGLRATGVAEGIDGFVPKPFSVQALEGVVAGRVAKARRLAARARDESGLTSVEELHDRLADRMEAARLGGTGVALALVHLAVRSEAGTRGEDLARRRLAEAAGARLPAGTVIGRTRGPEIAAVLPDVAAGDAQALLEAVVQDVTGTARLPGGAAVHVAAAAGLAAYPAHAATSDELYMCADAALAEALDSGATVVLAR